MTNLFAQLGLDSSAEAIQNFIETHQLAVNKHMMEAEFWSPAQRQFLSEKVASDGEWAITVDQLNESLHEDSISYK